MITRQKVLALLRKAGYDKAKYERSGQIRGWGEWSEGYRVEQVGDAVTIRHIVPHTMMRREGVAERKMKRTDEYQKTLERAGIKSVLENADVLAIYPERNAND